MLLKALLGIGFCLSSLLAGREAARLMKQRLAVIDAYLAVTRALESGIRFGGRSVREVLAEVEDGPAKPFCQKVCLSTDVETVLRQFRPANAEEQACLNELREGLLLSQRCADRNMIADTLRYAVERMIELKKRREETLNGKIELAPRLSLVLGLMLTVLML